MQVRQAVSSDQDAIKRLIYRVLEEFGLRPDPEGIDRDLDDINGVYFASGGFFGVVEQEGSIVATVAIGRVSARTCELRKMYALPVARGAGLGEALLKFAINKAVEMGFREMTLETATPLVAAINLYKKYGFERYHPPHLAWRCDQAYRRILPPSSV